MEEQQKDKPTGRGGAGRGQGRKSKSGGGSSPFFSFRCSQEVYDILQMQPNKTAYVEAAIKEKHRREQLR